MNKSGRPAVSVCMPVYNGSAYLESAFTTLAAQTFRDFEVIVANDGSIDDSGTRARSLLKQHGLRGTVIDGPNRGCEQARDIACRNSRGDILAAFDCDDLWDPEYLEVMTTVLLDAPDVGLVYCDFDEHHVNDGVVVRKSATTPWINRSLALQVGDIYQFPAGSFFPLLLQGQVLFPPCTVFRKSVHQQVGGYAARLPDLRISLDWDFGLRASRICGIAYVDRPLLHKSRHDSNTSGNPLKTACSDVSVIKNLLRDRTLTQEESRLARARGATRALDATYAARRIEGDGRLARKLAWQAMRWQPSAVAAKSLLLAFAPAKLTGNGRKQRTARLAPTISAEDSPPA